MTHVQNIRRIFKRRRPRPRIPRRWLYALAVVGAAVLVRSVIGGVP